MPAYKIHVTNVPWDIDYNHAVRFASASARHDYFAIDWTAAPLVNLDFGTGFRTSAVVTTENTRAASQYNYAVIYDVTNDLYYYYFVQRAEYLAANKYRYHLVCDVIQQTLFDITFGDCMIRRAHLNRWVHHLDTDDYTYNFLETSPFFDDDFPEVGTRVISTEKLGFNFYNTAAGNWIKNNVIAWKYYFLPVGQYNMDSFVTAGTAQQINIDGLKYIINDLAFQTDWAVLCAPIFTDDTKSIQFTSETDDEKAIQWNSTAYDKYFKEKNDGIDAKLYAVKISMIPPFSSFSGITVTVSDNILTIDTALPLFAGTARLIPVINGITTPTDENFLSYEWYGIPVGYEGANEFVIFVIQNQTIIKNDLPVLVTYPAINNDGFASFSNAYIKVSSSILCPQLQSKRFNGISVNTGTGKKHVFDLRVLGENSGNLRFYYISVLSPYISTEYVTPIVGDDSAIYANGDLYKTYYGYFDQNDDILAVAISQYESFIANQKNFYKAFEANQWAGVAKMAVNSVAGVAGTAAGFLTSGGAAGFSGSVGTIAGAFNSATDLIMKEINAGYKINDLQNAPQTLSAASGDILTNISILNRGINVEKFSVLNYDNHIILDFYNKYGYRVNRLGNVSDYVGIRKLWNFIQADVETVNSANDDNPIGVEMHDQIKTIFARGITFWTNPAGISDYSGQNYEVSLDG